MHGSPNLPFSLLAALLVAACGAPAKDAAPSVSARVPPAKAPAMVGGGNKVLVEEVGLSEFFADEDAELRASTTAWLRANTPWEVVAADQVEVVRARAVAGKHIGSGEACGRSIHSHEGYQRAFGSYDAADLSVTCAPTCRVEVSIFRGLPGASQNPLSPEGSEFRFSARVDSPPTKEAVLRAISELRRDDATDQGTIGLGGLAVGERRPPRPRAAVKLSVWSALAKDAFASAQPDLDACYRPGASQEMYLLSVDSRGRVDRCEGRPWSEAPSRECVCAALKKVQLPANVAGKRAGFDVVHEDRDVVTKNGVVAVWFDHGSNKATSPFDRGIEAFSFPIRADAALCFERDPPGGSYEVPVTWTVRRDATIAAVHAGWSGAFPTPATRACVEKALSSTSFPCPTVTADALTVSTRLHVETHASP